MPFAIEQHTSLGDFSSVGRLVADIDFTLHAVVVHTESNRLVKIRLVVKFLLKAAVRVTAQNIAAALAVIPHRITSRQQAESIGRQRFRLSEYRERVALDRTFSKRFEPVVFLLDETFDLHRGGNEAPRSVPGNVSQYLLGIAIQRQVAAQRSRILLIRSQMHVEPMYLAIVRSPAIQIDARLASIVPRRISSAGRVLHLEPKPRSSVGLVLQQMRRAQLPNQIVLFGEYFKSRARGIGIGHFELRPRRNRLITEIFLPQSRIGLPAGRIGT